MTKRRSVAIVMIALATLVSTIGAGVALAQSQAVPAYGQPRAPLLRFAGVVEERPESELGMWVVSGRSVLVVEETRFDESLGMAEVGAHVLVAAQRPEPSPTAEVVLEAVLIRVLGTPQRPVILTGEITLLEDGRLKVDNTEVWYDETTEIVGTLERGLWVKVNAVRTEAGLKASSIRVLPAEGRIVEFEGTIDSMRVTHWVIGGRDVLVTRRTQIVGVPEVGRVAKVRALVDPVGTLHALVITIEEAEPVRVELRGTIDRLPPSIAVMLPHLYGKWVVGGRDVWVTRDTVVLGAARIGRMAHVVALLRGSRPLEAVRIEVVEGAASEGWPHEP